MPSWIKKVVTILVMLAAVAYGVAQMIPGENPDIAIKKVHDTLEKLNNSIPE